MYLLRERSVYFDIIRQSFTSTKLVIYPSFLSEIEITFKSILLQIKSDI